MAEVVLSNRMQALTDMVTPGTVITDVGCDHGFVSVYLVQKGISPRVIAMDVRSGPLERAREHIREYDLQDRIETRLSDGLQSLEQGEADGMICAGMGGPLMEKILTEGRSRAREFRELILQPQSEIPAFRFFLQNEGYLLLDENIVCEEGKYYFMMKVRWLGETSETAVCGKVRESWNGTSELAKQYGPILLARRNPVLREYLERMLEDRRQIAEHMQMKADADNPKTRKRRQEMTEEIFRLSQALEWYDNEKGQGEENDHSENKR